MQIRQWVILEIFLLSEALGFLKAVVQLEETGGENTVPLIVTPELPGSPV